jgi:V/A-type H+/Na+-transporting ATPase subunit E
MSSTKIKEGLEGIASEVIADVQKEAEIIILQAEKDSKEILKLAKDDSDKVYATIMAEAMAKASSEKRKINSKAEVEARNRLLQAKESLLNSTFEKAQIKLNKIVDSDAYHELLIGLIEEAAKKIGLK